jgi:SNF2 family DNA or RNA helicase
MGKTLTRALHSSDSFASHMTISYSEPTLTLPPTEVVTVNVELTAVEREFYNSLLEKSQSVFEGYIKSGTASKSWFAIFSLLNRLRQACDHVALTVKSQLDETEWNPEALEVNGSPVKKKAASPSPAKRKKASKDNDALGEDVSVTLMTVYPCNLPLPPSHAVLAWAH